MDLHKKIQLLQNDHKSNIEFVEESKKAHQEDIQRLKEENQKLRTKLLNRDKGSSNGGGPSKRDDKPQPVALQAAVDQARREGDDLKMQTLQMEKALDELRDQVRALDLELSGTGSGAAASGASASGATGPDDHVQSLESQLENTLEQQQEAQSILQTYKQIIKRRKEERVSFDQHLSALERTVQLKDHDLEELIFLSNDANHASEVAQQELAKRRTGYEAARSQREDKLRDRQRAIQVQLRKRKQERKQQPAKQRTGHDDAGKRRNEAVSEDEKEEEDADEQEDDETGERLAASKVELEALRQCCRRIKDFMGISEAHEVVAKLTQQTDTMENLLTISEENQARLTSLQQERANLKAQTETRKYTPRRDKAEGLRQQLGQCRERLEQAQAKRDQLVGLLNSVKCSVLEHLCALLKKGDGRTRGGVPAVGSPKGKAQSNAQDQALLHKTLQGLETGLRDLMRKTDAMKT